MHTYVSMSVSKIIVKQRVLVKIFDIGNTILTCRHHLYIMNEIKLEPTMQGLITDYSRRHPVLIG